MDTDFLPDTGFGYPTPKIQPDLHLARSDFSCNCNNCRPINKITITAHHAGRPEHLYVKSLNYLHTAMTALLQSYVILTFDRKKLFQIFLVQCCAIMNNSVQL